MREAINSAREYDSGLPITDFLTGRDVNPELLCDIEECISTEKQSSRLLSLRR